MPRCGCFCRLTGCEIAARFSLCCLCPDIPRRCGIKCPSIVYICIDWSLGRVVSGCRCGPCRRTVGMPVYDRRERERCCLRRIPVRRRCGTFGPFACLIGWYLSVNYLFVVTRWCVNAVICTMKRQRRNNFLIGQVVHRLKECRQARNLTQETVSDHTRLNIGRIETGRHDISLSTLAILCDYYDVPPGELF